MTIEEAERITGGLDNWGQSENFTPPKKITDWVVNNTNKKGDKNGKNKKINIYKNLILDVPGVTSAQFEKSIESSVTTSWGVNWDADFIARDILQNFRDANLNEIEKVKLTQKMIKFLLKVITVLTSESYFLLDQISKAMRQRLENTVKDLRQQLYQC